jgi:hypothetical protein
MRCSKCLAPLAVCACVAIVGSFVTVRSDDCEFPRPASIRLSLCDLPTVDLPHNEPNPMPGRPLPNLTVSVAVSTSSSTSVSSGIFRWPSTST